jgi:endonuclease G, mitochondrial
MNKCFLLLISLLVLKNSLFAQIEAITKEGRAVILFDNGTWKFTENVNAGLFASGSKNAFGIPELTDGDQIVTQSAFTLSWNKNHKHANWVAYHLTKDKVKPGVERTNKFIPDPSILSGTANNGDYAKSGYDRGHLAPAADMSWSAKTMSESFYYSNISPQVPGFNRGVWKVLEEHVRTWAVENKAVHVVTGPVLTEGLPSIGANKISVPQFYYKVVLDIDTPGIKGIGFILPNAMSSKSLDRFAVTIDSVERFTGINFFPLITATEEELIERKINLKEWRLGEDPSEEFTENLRNGSVGHLERDKVSTSQSKSKKNLLIRCSGLAKSNTRCKRMTTNLNGKCWQHLKEL